MSRKRSCEFFSRQPVRTRLTFGGTLAGSARQSGSRIRIAASVSATSSCAKGLTPVSISKRTHPKARRPDVAAFVRGPSLGCSGAIYAAVPSNVPTPVIIAGDVIVGDNDPSGRLKPAPTFGA